MQGVHIPRTRWHHIGSSHDRQSANAVPAAGSGMDLAGTIGGPLMQTGNPWAMGAAAGVESLGAIYDAIRAKKEQKREEERRKSEERAEQYRLEREQLANMAAGAGAESELSQSAFSGRHGSLHGLASGGTEQRTAMFGNSLTQANPQSRNGFNYSGNHGNVAGNPAGFGQTMWNVGKRIVPLGLSLYRPTLGNWLNTGTSLMSGNLLGAGLSGLYAGYGTLNGNLFQKGVFNSWDDAKKLFQKHIDFDPSSSQGRWNILGKAAYLLPVLSSWGNDRKYSYPTMNQSGYYY